jgi:hypothetical protein
MSSISLNRACARAVYSLYDRSPALRSLKNTTIHFGFERTPSDFYSTELRIRACKESRNFGGSGSRNRGRTEDVMWLGLRTARTPYGHCLHLFRNPPSNDESDVCCSTLRVDVNFATLRDALILGEIHARCSIRGEVMVRPRQKSEQYAW